MTAAAESLALPAALRQRMLEHALGNPAEEVCGLVGGRGGTPAHYYPVANDAPDRSRRFLMNPGEQIAAMRRMRNAGEDLLGIFHSHPAAPAEPSAVDLELAAYPGTVYFIASLAGASTDLRAYRFDGTGFHPLRIR
jgi:proteasome lid subunit RPN8/RPN11